MLFGYNLVHVMLHRSYVMTKHARDGGEIGGHPENTTNTTQLQTPCKHWSPCLDVHRPSVGDRQHLYKRSDYYAHALHAVRKFQSSNVSDSCCIHDTYIIDSMAHCSVTVGAQFVLFVYLICNNPDYSLQLLGGCLESSLFSWV